MARLLPLADVSAKTVFQGSLVPDLGLRGGPDDEFAVYVLQSGDKYYVGVVERRFLKVRLAKHAEGRGAHWNKVHVPDGVAYVMPVPHRAAEACVFFALLAKMPAKSLQRLGGWTQTAVNPSPLARMLAQEAHRNIRGSCFRAVLRLTYNGSAKQRQKPRPIPVTAGRLLKLPAVVTLQK